MDFLYLCSEIKCLTQKQKDDLKQQFKPFHFWPSRTRATVFSLHSAPVSLAQTEGITQRRSGFMPPHKTETAYISSVRSKHNLSTPRAALKLPFLGLISGLILSSEQSQTFIRGNLHFPPTKLRVSSDPPPAPFD